MATSSLSSSDAGAGRRPLELIDLAAQQARIRDRVDAAIKRVLDHGKYIMGPEIAELERQLSAFTGGPHALSCASGTDSLLMAAMALGLGPGQAVLCPGFTFTATPESMALLGATIVFVDVDPVTFNIDPAALEGGMAEARRRGLQPAGVVAVDLFGQPADYDAISAFARRHGLWIIADAAQSFGASLAGRKVGTLGTITATSFFPAKPLGCYGDGGAAFTADADLAAAMESIRQHGRARSDKYDIERVGVNGRLDTLQAAILIEKLAIFSDEVERRQVVARRYREGLAGALTVPSVAGHALSVWAQYTVLVPPERRAAIMTALAADGIPTAIYYPRPVPHQTAYRHFPVAGGELPVSERLARSVLSLPMHPYLEADDQAFIVDRVRRAVAG